MPAGIRKLPSGWQLPPLPGGEGRGEGERFSPDQAPGIVQDTGNLLNAFRRDTCARSRAKPLIPPARRRSTAGFTLFEIMIVVGIMMLVAAIGLPAMVRTLNKEGMRKAVSDIMEGCSHARAVAILQSRPMELVIRGQDGSITIQPAKPRSRDDADGAGSISSLSLLQEPETKTPMPSFTGHLPDEVAVQMLDVNFHNLMEMDEARVKFHPNGTCDEFTIVLQGPDGEIRKISLEVMTSLPEMEILREAR